MRRRNIPLRVAPALLVLALASAFSAAPASAAAVDLNALEAALENGRLVQARTMIEQAARTQPHSPRLRLLQAEYHLAAGQLEQAVAIFQPLLTGEHGARAGQGLGLALLRQHEAAAAVEALATAVRQNPALWRAWNALGVAHDQLGQWGEAEAAYAQALAAQPDAPQVHSNRGYSRLLQNRADQAVADLELAAALLPENETVRTNLHLALALAGRYEAALAAPGAILPGAQAQVLNNVGYAALLRGDHDTARALFSRALAASDVHYAMAAGNLALVDAGAPKPLSADPLNAALLKDGS